MAGYSLEYKIEPLRTSGVKYAAAYDYVWWLLDHMVKVFVGDVEPTVRQYHWATTNKAAQQEQLGRRPYTKTTFTYFLPEYAGTSWVAAELTRHWLELALALWQSEHDRYLEREGVRWLSPLPTREQVVRAGRWIVFRRATWQVGVNAGGLTVSRQGDQGVETLPLDALTSEEQEAVRRAHESGLCHCMACSLVVPHPLGVERVENALTQSHSFDSSGRVGWWIASLTFPTPELIGVLLDRASALVPRDSTPFASQWEPLKAFCLLGERVPGAAPALRDGLDRSEPWTRAVALAGLQGAIAGGHYAPDEALWQALPDMLASELPEVVAASEFLAAIAPPPAERDTFSTRLAAAVERWDDSGYDGARVASSAFSAWKTWYAGSLPPNLRECCQRYVQAHPLSWGGRTAYELLGQPPPKGIG